MLIHMYTTCKCAQKRVIACAWDSMASAHCSQLISLTVHAIKLLYSYSCIWMDGEEGRSASAYCISCCIVQLSSWSDYVTQLKHSVFSCGTLYNSINTSHHAAMYMHLLLYNVYTHIWHHYHHNWSSPWLGTPATCTVQYHTVHS